MDDSQAPRRLFELLSYRKTQRIQKRCEEKRDIHLVPAKTRNHEAIGRMPARQDFDLWRAQACHHHNGVILKNCRSKLYCGVAGFRASGFRTDRNVACPNLFLKSSRPCSQASAVPLSIIV